MKFVAVLALFAASVSTLRTTRDEEHELFFKCDRIGGEKCGHLIGFRSCCQPENVKEVLLEPVLIISNLKIQAFDLYSTLLLH